MSDIFVSYASEDRARAEAISKALEAEGWSVWWDRAIPAGRRFSEVIEEEIRRARCMVVLWSAVSVAKDWVVEEAEDGKSRGILVPVFIEAVQPPRGFRRIEAADLSGWRGGKSDTAFRTLCQNIASVAGAPAVAAAPGTQRVQGAGDVIRAVPRQHPPGVLAAPEGWRNPRLWLIASAIGIFAVGTAISALYWFRAYKGPSARVNPKDGLIYVYIPPGKFTMGCSPGDTECDADEKPPHEVTITRGFWMGQTPVTQEAYQRVTGNNPSSFKGSRFPVEQVTWNEAQAYCKTVEMRLPTEAEWEYAARARSTGARYGNLDSIAWYSANSGGTPHEVGQKQPNGFGLYDMLGNVLQWLADWYNETYYGQSPSSDPPGPASGQLRGASGQLRVLRGGNWDDDPRLVRASGRVWDGPTLRSFDIGFRCAGELH